MRKRNSVSGAMLELWRPPHGAGDPVGCLATTYTFAPGLFDEQCLARFLEIESEPNREDLAFLLERESKLGGIYAGVMVDYSQAGVEHSLRWDVLPVRIPSGKQHAKLSLLVWTRYIRIIVASANLTDPGYRTNHEVAAAIELTGDNANNEMLARAIDFLRSLLEWVPGASDHPPEVRRAEAFLEQVLQQTQDWKGAHRESTIRQHLVFTVPSSGARKAAQSSLEEALEACRQRGGLPDEVWVASPFFDEDKDIDLVTDSLCKSMTRGKRRRLCFCVPAIREGQEPVVARLAAPKSLIQTPMNYEAKVTIRLLPERDEDKNRRPWHAKMLGLFSRRYAALMVGSSNYTSAGMGLAEYRNAEANLLTVLDHVAYSKEIAKLEKVWPDMEKVVDPEAAEWLGALSDHEEEEHAKDRPVPSGFLVATYRAGDERFIVVRLEPSKLPQVWQIHACGREAQELLTSSVWREKGETSVVKIVWKPIQPPEKLLVRWGEYEAFLPLNVEDSRHLPPPTQFEHLSAEDMLNILAAADPSAAIRTWTRQHQPSGLIDDDLDSAIPIDLNPLKRYDLQATFLHRIRHRARVLAQLRSNLQRPVWGRQALEWRLRGLVGVESLMDRLVRELAISNNNTDEALLTLTDFLIVLNEVDYQPGDGLLTKAEFGKIYQPFIRGLIDKLQQQIVPHRDRVSKDIMQFWERVVGRCRE